MTNAVSAGAVTSVVVKAMPWADDRDRGGRADGRRSADGAARTPSPDGAADPVANSSVQQAG